MAGALSEGERWFVDRGLPWFVDEIRAQVTRSLRFTRLLVLALVAVLAAGLMIVAALAVGEGDRVDDLALGIAAGSQLALIVVAIYALTALKGFAIARWAARRTLGSLGLLFPLVTRALPLLLLFITFLFVNAEVWQVSATLDGAVMSWTILLFCAVAVGFLLVRLPEEMEIFDRELDPVRVAAGCRGTPFEGVAATYSDADAARRIIDDPHDLLGLGIPRLSRELLQVSVFLAAFSGLYFTVYAVTDELYRKQFFTEITDELELAVTARAAYRLEQTAP